MNVRATLAGDAVASYHRPRVVLQPDRWQVAARTLLIDRRSAEVIGALAGDGIPSLLLKGPGIASLLYVDGATRSYVDTDLLVPAQLLRSASATLARLGYIRADLNPDHVAHASPWRRGARSGEAVDLHRTLPGALRPSGELWPALWNERRTLRVGGRDVDVLGLGGTALLLVTHVNHHLALAKPREDLRRGVAQLDSVVWIAAHELARVVGAQEAFEAGLRREAPELADALGVPGDRARGGRAEDPPSGFGLTLSAGGPIAVCRAIAHKLLPPAEYMRAFEGCAGDRRSLGVAYLRRWRRLAGAAPETLKGLRRPGRVRRGSD